MQHFSSLCLRGGHRRQLGDRLMARDAEWLKRPIEELRPEYGLLVAKGIAEKEHKLERLATLRVSANLANDYRMIELVDIVREVVDGR